MVLKKKNLKKDLFSGNDHSYCFVIEGQEMRKKFLGLGADDACAGKQKPKVIKDFCPL